MLGEGLLVLCRITLQARFAVAQLRHHACAQQHDARPPSCSQEHMQQHGPRAVGRVEGC